MEYKNLTLPDNAEQLAAMYGPNGDDSPLMGELHLLESYLRNELPPQAPQRCELDRRTVTDIRRRMIELKAEIFRSALLEFTRQACEEQRDICLTNFYDAPCGEEAEWIGGSRMPDIYLQGEYERLHDWWNNLAKDRKERPQQAHSSSPRVCLQKEKRGHQAQGVQRRFEWCLVQ